MHGNKATAQVDDDKSTAIGCCVVSDTMTDSVPAELLLLDIRTMERLPEGGGEDVEEEGDEDGWVDEDWDDDEGQDEE